MAKAVMQSMVLGPVATNCILLKNSETGEIILVDPADEARRIIDAVTRMNGNPVGILLTHGHFDHICAVNELKDLYEVPVYAFEKEQDVLEDPFLNLSASWHSSYTTKADILLKDRETFTLAGFSIEVIHTPGHTHGSCCYYIPEEEMLLSGDTLFAGSVGRMDFPTSSGAQMQNSIRILMDILPGETKVYPGHGESTTIDYEKRYNPFA